MSRSLNDIVKTDIPTLPLGLDESISVHARRQALSYAFQDEESGIFEFHLPMAPSPSVDSDIGAVSEDETLAVDDSESDVGTSEETKFKREYTSQDKTDDSFQHVAEQDVAFSILTAHESVNSTLREWRLDIKDSSINAQPGAFRVEGINASQTHLRRQISEDSLVLTVTPASLVQIETQILVNAELVANCEDTTEPRHEALVDAMPLELSDRSHSIVDVICSDRRRQLYAAILFIAVAMIVASLIVNLGRHDKAPSNSTELVATASPEANQTNLIIGILKTKLSPDSAMMLNDDTSPQFKAVRWLEEDSDLHYYDEERIVQRYALATFFYSTGGPITWKAKEGWLGSGHECSWFADSFQPPVLCRNGTIQHLHLMGNGLGGSLPEDLFLLTDLVTITLDVNAIVGYLPDKALKNAPKLETLSINANLLSGTIPTEIGLLTSLKKFHLANNGIQGTLPSEIGLLTNAIAINIFLNFLNGTIPTDVGRLTSVRTFDIWGNTISGSIPSEVGAMITLTEFSLHTNILSGSLPTELGKLDRLQIFELQRNMMSGKLPKEFSNFKFLSFFNVGNNSFSGTIPVFEASNLTFFSMYNNWFSGTIPSAVGSITSLEEFYIDNNRLSGTIPSELGLLTVLQNFWAEGNLLKGALPSEVCNLQAIGGTTLSLDCDALNCSCGKRLS